MMYMKRVSFAIYTFEPYLQIQILSTPRLVPCYRSEVVKASVSATVVRKDLLPGTPKEVLNEW